MTTTVHYVARFIHSDVKEQAPPVFDTHHHWDLIGCYPQVGGGGCSAALLDPLALSSIGGGVCSY